MRLHSGKSWLQTCALFAILTAFTTAAVPAPTTTGPSAPPPAAAAAPPGTTAAPADPAPVPGFWDPRRRPERPDLSRISIIRFLTETDYPPFNYAGPDGAPIGFNVD